MSSSTEPPNSFGEGINRNSQAIASKKVLIIEDDPSFARILGSYLGTFGHEVEIVERGAAGLEKTRELALDVVICDIRLPDMDGWSIAEQLDQSSYFQRPALLIALTGLSEERDRAQSSRSGFDLHITKPPDFEKLQEVVSSLSVESYA
jgi:CheY-like chemotaxis protein